MSSPSSNISADKSFQCAVCWEDFNPADKSKWLAHPLKESSSQLIHIIHDTCYQNLKRKQCVLCAVPRDMQDVRGRVSFLEPQSFFREGKSLEPQPSSSSEPIQQRRKDVWGNESNRRGNNVQRQSDWRDEIERIYQGSLPEYDPWQDIEEELIARGWQSASQNNNNDDLAPQRRAGRIARVFARLKSLFR